MSAPSSTPPFTPEEEVRIRRRVRARGLAFEVFLPEGMADWLSGQLAAEVFESPAEAAFVAFQQLIALDRHPEVKRQLLAATIQSSLVDLRPGTPAKEVFARLRARTRALAAIEADGEGPPTADER